MGLEESAGKDAPTEHDSNLPLWSDLGECSISESLDKPEIPRILTIAFLVMLTTPPPPSTSVSVFWIQGRLYWLSICVEDNIRRGAKVASLDCLSVWKALSGEEFARVSTPVKIYCTTGAETSGHPTGESLLDSDFLKWLRTVKICPVDPYVERDSSRGVKEATTGITGLWQPGVHNLVSPN